MLRPEGMNRVCLNFVLFNAMGVKESTFARANSSSYWAEDCNRDSGKHIPGTLRNVPNKISGRSVAPRRLKVVASNTPERVPELSVEPADDFVKLRLVGGCSSGLYAQSRERLLPHFWSELNTSIRRDHLWRTKAISKWFIDFCFFLRNFRHVTKILLFLSKIGHWPNFLLYLRKICQATNFFPFPAKIWSRDKYFHISCTQLVMRQIFSHFLQKFGHETNTKLWTPAFGPRTL